ncbi:bifunctional indole-3-glycerol-phosphate synthase TrpC/phosphoribosylanthranilate isomerase TrpF [Sphingomonas sabuli]|uniref:Multifunctional fusion protein n=1 Tax=Sphingomonas sabuli TaxID=2764186 RepID=A0A7G9L1G2_9SPHN|nr:bifunctional indole-3-glycerol-phosphate synthase TrpC/phosphoribosylanthranilate isomerase TrpF [Sphingomonas sabuli]QNM82461.1 bifunctional indole-3-glycerol-phosphate synthase TrpC/phosphoribosylanthranilate isomerase TrpF [Sphingomonas sabuli]
MAEGILGRIEAAKQAEIAERFAGVTLDSLRRQARPSTRDFAAALAKPGSRFILEIKKASPSAGAIRPGADPAAIARGYAGVADALSVLTDAGFFGGSTDDLAAARRAFDGPILAKDFFIDARQVVEARIAGADAVLVMMSLVGDAIAHDLIAEAQRLGMEALVEVHDEAEMHRAKALGARVIGINNRDLRDLSIDLATTVRLARLAGDAVLVSESGISTRNDVDLLARHVDAFLVGSSLMKSDNPAAASRDLVFGRVKLCGLRTERDIEAAAPATFAGFVFVPPSPRHIIPGDAAPLAGLARSRGVLPVGVFQDAPLNVVSDLAALLNLHAVQLHGAEDETYVRRLKRELDGHCEVWTAVSVGRGPIAFRDGHRTLFDNGPGGTGRPFDWNQIRDHARLQTGLVAGGLGTANVREAAALGAYAIDVGSSVDSSPGVKSPRRIAEVFDALRAPSRREVERCD